MAIREFEVDRGVFLLARLRLKLTISELAEKLSGVTGCSPRDLNSMSSEVGALFSFEAIEAVAKALELPDIYKLMSEADSKRLAALDAPTKRSEVRLTIPGDIEDSPERFMEFFKRVNDVVKHTGSVTLDAVTRSNSVNLVLGMSATDADRFMQAWRDGRLKDLGVTDCTVAETPDDPWEGAAARYPVGSIVRVKVLSPNYGLPNYPNRVEVEPGLEGTYVGRQDDQPPIVGSHFYCRVLYVLPDSKSLMFGPERSGDVWYTDIPKRYRTGTPVRGVITEILPFSIRIELEPSVPGVLVFTEASPGWPKDYAHLTVGDEIEAYVMHVEADRKFVNLQESLPSAPSIQWSGLGRRRLNRDTERRDGE